MFSLVDPLEELTSVRQITFSSLNSTVHLLSTNDKDSIEKLSGMGLDLLKSIKLLNSDK